MTVKGCDACFCKRANITIPLKGGLMYREYGLMVNPSIGVGEKAGRWLAYAR
jgi:hypothetical protein